MLVLDVRVGDKIRIGNDIVLVVGDMRSWGKVKLCFDAPREIGIWREELLGRTGQPRKGVGRE